MKPEREVRAPLHPSLNGLVLPNRIKALPVSERGFPVPWFVWWSPEGVPDFRIVDTPKLALAMHHRLCWVCGQPLGVRMAFVIGPMCLVNRINSEPPSHRECAVFSAMACPFLTRPHMKRQDKNMPEEHRPAPGFMIERNPGATVVYGTRSYEPFQPQRGVKGVLFHLGEPDWIEWYAEGRRATRDEVTAAMESGLPLLREMALKDGKEGLDALEKYIRDALALIPAA